MQKYIVLLRKVNIGGKNKVLMSDLKKEIENIGCENVITYLNSGNVILDSDDDKDILNSKIKLILKDKFNVDTSIYIITYDKLKDILNNAPTWWNNGDKEIYSNIIFVMSPVSANEVINSVGDIKDNIDMIMEYNDVIFWSFNLKRYKNSTWWKKTATIDIKDNITIRTGNTVKKLLGLFKKSI